MDKLEKKILYKIGEANKKFNLIENGDRIMVGLSGGKDSWSLLHLLNILRQKVPFKYELMAVNIDPGYEGYRTDILEKALKEMGYEYHIEKTCILDIIKAKMKRNSYCSFCSRLRRGILYDVAVKFKCNKIALGHHMDDFIETLLLNQFFIGKIKAMPAKLYSDDGRNIVIRPLVYVEEKYTAEYAVKKEFPVIFCKCPGCDSHNSRRFMIKKLLSELEKEIPEIKSSLIKSLSRVEGRYLLDNSIEERAMSSVVEQSPSSIVITDTSGHIEYVNRKFTEITGYTPEEVKGKNSNILKSGETHPDVYKILWETIRAGHEWRGEFHNKKKNGEFYWEFASISPLRDASGHITHFLAIKEDITDRKKMEEELREAKEQAEVVNRVKSQVLSSISHELRTPMNSILGISKILMTRYADNLNEKQIKGLSMINESGTRLLDCIDHILELATLEAGKTELILEIFSLEDMIADIEGFIRNIKKDDIRFIITRDKGLPVSIFSDRKKIIQILVNFLANAVKFTSSGEIELKISMKDEAVIFSVHDTGTGISSENLDFIYDDFKDFDNGQLTGYKRIKRGLTISKKLAILLQGNIQVESEQGRGSTFSFIIPYFKI
ncbi:MAG: tRNA 2-thiocytidine(32) synthetase TtcA [Candidatus Eremiobacterota bacterium]